MKLAMAFLFAGLAGAVGAAPAFGTQEVTTMDERVSEHVYEGELVSFPGPWSFLPRAGIIVVSDDELRELAHDPDKVMNLTLTYEPRHESLRQVCERAQQAGQRTLMIAFDHFFAQYRPGQHKPRELTPDKPAYVELIAKIGAFAQTYGLGLELSLLTPLEIGPAYSEETGEYGRWYHYRKGLRDPGTGAFSVQLWRQKTWANNKGVFQIEDAGVRVFAFSEKGVSGAPYRVVDPDAMVEITDVARVDVWDNVKTSVAERIRVHGEGRADIGPLDRVLVVQQYRTPEMDYFGDKALPYLKSLVDRYAEAGVVLNGLYSDEMHIQQDWNYFGHHDNGEFALRYVSAGLEKRYAEEFGSEYADLAKYMIYFVYGQEDTVQNLSAKDGVMHVFGADPEKIRETALFRSRYYRMLQNGVTDLFVEAKRHAERLMGQRLESRAHATWAESPTIDCWNTRQENMNRYKYEYTSDFVWSCTVHQAAAACQDYFKWGDFLTGNGNDHAEGGWLDRNYFGLALGCSTGIINEIPYSYAAHWGMPQEVHDWRMSLVNTYGAAGSPLWGMVQDRQHRDVDVLMLYPLDLVAVEERFGSWMTQYGYANYITQDKLLELGRVEDGSIEMCGYRFTTLATTFEPFPSGELLDLMKRFVDSGGRLIWSGPPPVLTREGRDALEPWQALFGVAYTPGQNEGLNVPGRQVVFDGLLAGLEPQAILTGFLVDRIYPVTPDQDTAAVARVRNHVVGAHRAVGDNGGTTTFLGFRPRDDQSASLGYEMRTWFEVLAALGAYPPTGAFPGHNDNTEYLSRSTEYLACRFPNGSTAIARHLRHYEEGWEGGFARNRERDQEWLSKHPLPPDDLTLRDFRVNAHTVSYDGAQAVAFRVNRDGVLTAFAGSQAKEITIDGRTTVFADRPIGHLAWASIPMARRVPGGAAMEAVFYSPGTVTIPAPNVPGDFEVVAQGAAPGSRGALIPARREGESIVIDVTAEVAGRWLYIVPK